jgi:hypothetical protein
MKIAAIDCFPLCPKAHVATYKFGNLGYWGAARQTIADLVNVDLRPRLSAVDVHGSVSASSLSPRQIQVLSAGLVSVTLV